jgi:DNA-directed RNA polymerase subunit RPC12/RpoP
MTLTMVTSFDDLQHKTNYHGVLKDEFKQKTQFIRQQDCWHKVIIKIRGRIVRIIKENTKLLIVVLRGAPMFKLLKTRCRLEGTIHLGNRLYMTMRYGSMLIDCYRHLSSARLVTLTSSKPTGTVIARWWFTEAAKLICCITAIDHGGHFVVVLD